MVALVAILEPEVQESYTHGHACMVRALNVRVWCTSLTSVMRRVIAGQRTRRRWQVRPESPPEAFVGSGMRVGRCLRLFAIFASYGIQHMMDTPNHSSFASAAAARSRTNFHHNSLKRHGAAAAVAVALIFTSCDDGPSTPSGGDVASIEVSPPALSLTEGSTRALSARVISADGDTLGSAGIFWSSENPAVAQVSAEGIVTAHEPGVTQIAASKGGKSDVIPVTVVELPVGLVTVSPSTATLQVGGTRQFSAVVRDAGGGVLAGQPVEWASDNTAVATINAEGLVTAVSQGSATITASSDDVSGSAIVNVNPVPVASVTVDPSRGDVFLGRSLQLKATALGASGDTLAGRAFSWNSSDPSKATVSSSGVVTGLFLGTVTITATSEGKSGSSSVTVTLIPVSNVQVVPASASVAAGGTRNLDVRLLDDNGDVIGAGGRPITWSSSNTSVASVSQSGVVTAVATGQVTVTAVCEGKSGTAAITVTPAPVASIGVAPTTASISVGDKQQFTATLKDAAGNVLTGRPVTWMSGAPSVATVDNSGVATGIGAGSVVIIASAEGKQGTADLDVTPRVAVDRLVSVPASLTPTILMSSAPGTTASGTFRALAADGAPVAGRTFSVSSASPTQITARVLGNGTTDANGEGQFEITVPNGAGLAILTSVVITVEGKTLSWLVVGT